MKTSSYLDVEEDASNQEGQVGYRLVDGHMRVESIDMDSAGKRALFCGLCALDLAMPERCRLIFCVASMSN